MNLTDPDHPASANREKPHLQRQTSGIDREFGQSVYRLCGLTEEQIAIVEGKE